MRRHARVERLGLYKRHPFHSANVVDNFVMGERLPDQWLLRSRQFMKSASGSELGMCTPGSCNAMIWLSTSNAYGIHTLSVYIDGMQLAMVVLPVPVGPCKKIDDPDATAAPRRSIISGCSTS